MGDPQSLDNSARCLRDQLNIVSTFSEWAGYKYLGRCAGETLLVKRYEVFAGTGKGGVGTVPLAPLPTQEV